MSPQPSALSPISQPMRIGQGIDVHAFGPGDHVVIGGVRIAHTQGVVAHSDGDVAIHALCDAILGALALGDIGTHFPPSQERWRDADSRTFLRHCAQLMRQAGFILGNADITIVCELPKIAAHALAMRMHLAADLQCAIDRISVKATTTERLGLCGRGEGLVALASVLIEKNDA